MSSRTMSLSHKGTKIQVREGHKGRIEFLTDGVRTTPDAKTFEAATNEARKWLLANAGQMKGNYDR